MAAMQFQKLLVDMAGTGRPAMVQGQDLAVVAQIFAGKANRVPAILRSPQSAAQEGGQTGGNIKNDHCARGD